MNINYYLNLGDNEIRNTDEDSMSFDETLDLFSVFSPAAPFHVKCLYAFRIYDIDQDGVIGYQDMYDIAVLVSRALIVCTT